MAAEDNIKGGKVIRCTAYKDGSSNHTYDQIYSQPSIKAAGYRLWGNAGDGRLSVKHPDEDPDPNPST